MRVVVLGRNGLIGKALIKKLTSEDHVVYTYLRPDVDVVYFFASPSSQILFNYAPEYCWNETVYGFRNVLEFCAMKNIKLVYPSSATVYNGNNPYAQCKAALEAIHKMSGYKNILGLRIFAGYGKEAHKGEYASIIYQFIDAMKHGNRPVIFGDGEQTRDFIYVDDIADAIIAKTDEVGVIDIGTGISTSFNDVVDLINQELGTSIQPLYIAAPTQYIKDTPCQNAIQVKYSLREGIREILT